MLISGGGRSPCKPVSARGFPAIREFVSKRALVRDLRAKFTRHYSTLPTKFPKTKNRELIPNNREVRLINRDWRPRDLDPRLLATVDRSAGGGSSCRVPLS